MSIYFDKNSAKHFAYNSEQDVVSPLMGLIKVHLSKIHKEKPGEGGTHLYSQHSVG
jgi:hypothetical protein